MLFPSQSPIATSYRAKFSETVAVSLIAAGDACESRDDSLREKVGSLGWRMAKQDIFHGEKKCVNFHEAALDRGQATHIFPCLV